ncbi:Neutral/alkaline nonlysosomal ceramidase [Myriangium duriaei CBS 260.36]|uniref:Neutral ceramidase n=1 Tax=Myriangium duriaei CBS 260.36 TaxID=1168546 RepID=A0A9P4ML82_9PEZI|nr:Neutral/alkaline nonlysosomal ceramidase [Myriangium duriaei CBS 260.36]
MVRGNLFVALTATMVALVATISLFRFFSWTTSAYLISHVQLPLTSSKNPSGLSTGSRPTLVNGQSYLIGAGRGDITGPVAEIEFMGYADPDQLGTGLRQRLYTRAFIIGDLDKPQDRFVYLVQDIQSGDTAVRHGILEGLKELGPDYAVYGQQNVAVTGTHSHSGPGAWLNYLLPQIPSKGFNKQSYEAIVQGSIQAIQIAHESLQSGTIQIGSIAVPSANVNRSPFAYLANPESERNQYSTNTETNLTMLRLQSSSDGKDIAVLTWYATHGTSMHNNNTLVTGDNKGVAARLFETYAMTASSAAPNFVAGFSQSSVGDISPNINGAYCETGPQQGQECDFKTSLCAGKAHPCHARGSHWGLHDAGTASTYENGRRQYVSARSLYESMVSRPTAYKYISSPSGPVVKAMHVFVDFSNRKFALPNGTQVETCPAALGYSFAAGTSDGPGNKDFKQHNHGDPDANPFWELVRNGIHKPGPKQQACHGAKPILLDVGETLKPYLWSPNVVDVQFFRVGGMYIIVSPGEATTMAGRRWKDAVRHAAGSEATDVLLGGPANSYTHYIATQEEYGIQRYEGASTLYGPHTLASYLDLTSSFIRYLARNSSTSASLPPTNPALPPLAPGPDPPIHVEKSYSLIPPVIRDSPGLFKSFGQIQSDVQPIYHLPSTSPAPPAAPVVVQATFIAANPRNNLRLSSTFASIERYDPHTSSWQPFRSDADWSLVFTWSRASTTLATSSATIRWELAWELGSWGQHPATDEEGGDEVVNVVGAEKTELHRGLPFPRQSRSEGRRRRDARVEKKEEGAAGGKEMEIVGRKIRGFQGDYRSVEELRGRYRIRYYGDAKSLSGRIEGFEGVSSEFELV